MTEEAVMAKDERTEANDNTVKAVEMSFLGCLFDWDSGDALVQFAKAMGVGASEEWFTDKKCRIVWKAIEHLYVKGGNKSPAALDVIVTANEIARISENFGRRGREDSEDLSGVAIDGSFIDEAMRYVHGDSDLIRYADILRNACTGRKLVELCREVVTCIGTDNATVCSDLARRATEIITANVQSKEVDIRALNAELVDQYRTAYEEVQVKGNKDYTPGRKLPWRKMTFLYNGFNNGLHIIGARPSVGKTSFALQLIRFWCENGYRILFNGMDMASLEALKRPLAELSRVSSRKAQFGKASKEDIDRIVASAEKVNALYDKGLFSMITEPDVHAFKAHCSRRKAQGNLDIVVVDFIQLMHYKGSERLGDVQTITHVSEVLKSISNELGITVVALSQLSRDNVKGDGREPEISDLRGSGAIEQDATSVALLHVDAGVAKAWETQPPMQYAGGQFDPKVRPIWLSLKKNQNGDTGKIPFVVLLPTFSWYVGDYKSDENAAKFARVHDDWRHDPIEEVFSRNGCLISTESEMIVEEKNESLMNQSASMSMAVGDVEGGGMVAATSVNAGTEVGADNGAPSNVGVDSSLIGDLMPFHEDLEKLKI